MKFTGTKELVKMAEILERSAPLRWLVVGAEVVMGLYALPAVLHAAAAFFK